MAVGTATDPYQPIEGHYKLTRACLEALAYARTPVGLVTKGPMVVRDADVLLDVARASRCAVYMSVPTVDEDAWRTLEPGTAHPLQRLRAVRALVDAGVQAGVLMAPIVPGFSSSRAKLERTIKAIADHGAQVRRLQCHVSAGRYARALHGVPGARLPSPASAFRTALYEESTRPTPIGDEVKAMVSLLQQRHGMGPRPGVESAERAKATADVDVEQVAFRW